MTYHLNGKLVGVGGAATDTLKKCASQVQHMDLDTKAGREETVKTSAECAADGFCGAYKVPPGICGPIAGAITGEAIKVWNAIFGDDSAQRAALKRRMETAAYFAATQRIQDLDTQMSADLSANAKKLIDFYDKLIPNRKGAYGGGKTYANKFNTWSKDYGEESITVAGYENDVKIRLALVTQGLLHETKWIAPYALDPRSPNYYPVQPPNLMARMLGGMGMPAPADEWAKARQSQLKAECAKQLGTAQMFCNANVPSLTALKTQYANSLSVIVEQFYVSMDKAMLLLRADITAQAVKEKLLLQTKGKAGAAVASTTQAKLGAAVLLVGAAAAAGMLYKARR